MAKSWQFKAHKPSLTVKTVNKLEIRKSPKRVRPSKYLEAEDTFRSSSTCEQRIKQFESFQSDSQTKELTQDTNMRRILKSQGESRNKSLPRRFYTETLKVEDATPQFHDPFRSSMTQTFESTAEQFNTDNRQVSWFNKIKLTMKGQSLKP